MTTVVTMQDPAAVLKKEVIKIEPGQQMADFVPRMMPHFDVRYTSVFLNNRKIELPKFKDGELVDRGDEDTLTTALSDSDVVVIVNEPKGISLGAIIIASLVAAAVTFLMMPSIPGNEAKQSSNNKLFGQTNTARVYDATPDIYGKIVSYPDLITPEDTLYFEANQPQIRQLMCVGVGYYDIPDETIKLGGTPLGLVPGATVNIYEPAEDGFTTIPNYEWHKSVSEVDGQELIGLGAESYNVPCDVDYDDVTDTLVITASDSSFSFGETLASGDTADITTVGIAGTYTLTAVNGSTITIENASTFQAEWSSTNQADFPAQSDVYVSRPEQLTEIGPFDTEAPGDGFVVDIKYPRGLVQKEVDVTVTYWEIDKPGGTIVAGPFTETVTHYPINVGTFNFSGLFSVVEVSKKTYDQQDRSIFVDVSGIGGEKKFFRVQVRRNNETSDNVEKPDLAKWARLASVYREPEKRIQGVTIVDFNLPGTKAAISPRENNLNMKVTRKTISYDLATGEVINELTPSLSFADAILHEYVEVFRRPVSGIDLDELYAINEEINAINSELGEFSFTFDDIDVGLGERIETIATAARVRAYRDGTIWRFSREGVKPLSGQITRKDISSERRYSKTWKPRLPSESDSVRVEYTNHDTNKKAYVYRSFLNNEIVDTPGLNHLDIKLAGCRNLAQAEDRANLEIRRMMFDGYTITDTLLIQGNMYDIGQVVEYADVYREDITDGEILDFDGIDTLTLSEELDVPITAFVSFTGQFGEVYGPFPCVRSFINPGKTNSIRVLPNLDFEDAKTEIYLSNGIEVQLGSRFILSSQSEMPPEKYTVNMKEPNNDGTVQLTLTQYDERMFEEGPFGDGTGGSSGGVFIRPPEAPTELTAPQGAWEEMTLNFDNSGFFPTDEIKHASISEDGQTIVFINSAGEVSKSTNGGTSFVYTQTFSDNFPGTGAQVYAVASSYDGAFSIYVDLDHRVFITRDRGDTWEIDTSGFGSTVSVGASPGANAVCCDKDGDFILAVFPGAITGISRDGGLTTEQGPSFTSPFADSALTSVYNACMSGDGQTIAISFAYKLNASAPVTTDGYVTFYSEDAGDNFSVMGVSTGASDPRIIGINYDGQAAMVMLKNNSENVNDIVKVSGGLAVATLPSPGNRPSPEEPSYYQEAIRNAKFPQTADQPNCVMQYGPDAAIGLDNAAYFESETVESTDENGDPVFTTTTTRTTVSNGLWYNFNNIQIPVSTSNRDVMRAHFNGKDWVIGTFASRAAINRG